MVKWCADFCLRSEINKSLLRRFSLGWTSSIGMRHHISSAHLFVCKQPMRDKIPCILDALYRPWARNVLHFYLGGHFEFRCALCARKSENAHSTPTSGVPVFPHFRPAGRVDMIAANVKALLPQLCAILAPEEHVFVYLHCIPLSLTFYQLGCVCVCGKFRLLGVVWRHVSYGRSMLCCALAKLPFIFCDEVFSPIIRNCITVKQIWKLLCPYVVTPRHSRLFHTMHSDAQHV